MAKGSVVITLAGVDWNAWGEYSRTQEDIFVEIFSYRGWILLDVPRVVIVRAILVSGLQDVGVLYHFCVKVVEGVVWNGVFDDD